MAEHLSRLQIDIFFRLRNTGMRPRRVMKPIVASTVSVYNEQGSSKLTNKLDVDVNVSRSKLVFYFLANFAAIGRCELIKLGFGCSSPLNIIVIFPSTLRLCQRSSFNCLCQSSFVFFEGKMATASCSADLSLRCFLAKLNKFREGDRCLRNRQKRNGYKRIQRIWLTWLYGKWRKVKLTFLFPEHQQKGIVTLWSVQRRSSHFRFQPGHFAVQLFSSRFSSFSSWFLAFSSEIFLSFSSEILRKTLGAYDLASWSVKCVRVLHDQVVSDKDVSQSRNLDGWPPGNTPCCRLRMVH